MSKYIVKNCGCNPSCDECYYRCADISDCLIKRVIDKCNSRKGTIMENFAEQILDMFDIEEVKE